MVWFAVLGHNEDMSSLFKISGTTDWKFRLMSCVTRIFMFLMEWCFSSVWSRIPRARSAPNHLCVRREADGRAGGQQCSGTPGALGAKILEWACRLQPLISQQARVQANSCARLLWCTSTHTHTHRTPPLTHIHIWSYSDNSKKVIVCIPHKTWMIVNHLRHQTENSTYSCQPEKYKIHGSPIFYLVTSLIAHFILFIYVLMHIY